MRIAESKLLNSQFVDRWSPRAFLDEPVPEAELMAMFEAAHWSPSCFNEQPWRFVFAQTAADRKRFLEILVPENQAWAVKAPVLMMLFAKNYFDFDKRLDIDCDFDAGAAWMSFSLQALSRGYHCHAMGGFHHDKAFEICGVDPQHYHVLAGIVVGKRDPNVSDLSADLRAIEAPNARHPLSRCVHEARFNPECDK